MLLIACLLFVWWYTATPRKLTFPGPVGIPLFGNIFQIDSNYPHVKLHAWAEKFGGVYALRLLNKNVMVVSSYARIRDILIDRGKLFSGRPKGLLRAEIASFNAEDIVFSNPNEPNWSILRKTVHRNIKLNVSKLDQSGHNSTEIRNNFFEKVKKINGKPVDLKEELHNLVLKTMLVFFIGQKLDDDDDDKILKTFKSFEINSISGLSMTGAGKELDIFPWLKYFGNQTFVQLKKAQMDLMKIWCTLKPKVMSVINIDHPYSIAEALLTVQSKHANKVRISDTNIVASLGDVLVAGITTTTTSLYAFINILLHHPDVMNNIYNEIMTVVGVDRAVKLSDRQQLHYTMASLLELFRYTTINPFGIPHAALENTTLAGQTVPIETIIILNYWALHHDKEFWIDPWDFRPCRFLGEDLTLVAADHPNRKHLLQFGAGPRVCVGEKLARGLIFLILTNLIKQFEMTPTSKSTSYDPRNYKVGLFLLPTPYTAFFTPRTCNEV